MSKNDFKDFCFLIFSVLIFVLLSVIPFVLISEVIKSYQNEPIYYKKYEVVDYNNNNTIAYNCSDMECELKDKTILSVKEYRYIGLEYIGIRKDIEKR